MTDQSETFFRGVRQGLPLQENGNRCWVISVQCKLQLTEAILINDTELLRRCSVKRCEAVSSEHCAAVQIQAFGPYLSITFFASKSHSLPLCNLPLPNQLSSDSSSILDLNARTKNIGPPILCQF